MAKHDIVESRASVAIEQEISRLESETETSRQQLAELQAGDDAALLAGDKEADAHDARKTNLTRSIRRAELKLQDLKPLLDQTREAEDAAILSERQRKATAAIENIKGRLDAEYLAPARAIAKFLRELHEAELEAARAGVSTLHEQTRVVPDSRTQEREETYQVYIAEDGSELASPFPGGAYHVDAQGRPLDPTNHQPLKSRPTRTKTRVVPSTFVRGYSKNPLERSVSLPGVALDDASIWPAAPMSSRREAEAEEN